MIIQQGFFSMEMMLFRKIQGRALVIHSSGNFLFYSQESNHALQSKLPIVSIDSEIKGNTRSTSDHSFRERYRVALKPQDQLRRKIIRNKMEIQEARLSWLFVQCYYIAFAWDLSWSWSLIKWTKLWTGVKLLFEDRKRIMARAERNHLCRKAPDSHTQGLQHRLS